MTERQLNSESSPSDTSSPELIDVDAVTNEELADFSAIGGPDSEPAYGRTRSLAGTFPFNEHGGSHDNDELSHMERGGIQTHHHVERKT